MKNDKFYLDCPYSEKDMVKIIGGRWDADERKWYVPRELDPKQFRRWWSKKTDSNKFNKLYVVK